MNDEFLQKLVIIMKKGRLYNIFHFSPPPPLNAKTVKKNDFNLLLALIQYRSGDVEYLHAVRKYFNLSVYFSRLCSITLQTPIPYSFGSYFFFYILMLTFNFRVCYRLWSPLVQAPSIWANMEMNNREYAAC